MAIDRDINKCYDKNGVELAPGDVVMIRARYRELARTDAGANCTVQLSSNDRGYAPIIAIASETVEKMNGK